MSESRAAFERASKLDVAVTQYIKSIAGQQVQATKVIRREGSVEVGQVVALFKSPRTARQAVIASLILGPPRSMEPAA